VNHPRRPRRPAPTTRAAGSAKRAADDGRGARGVRDVAPDAGRNLRRGASRGPSEGGVGGEQVEGRRAVRELLAAGRRRVKVVYLSASAEPAPIIDEIVELAGPALRVVPVEKLAALARSERPQGVIATSTPLQPADLDELLRDPRAFIVALDGVADPRNLGAVLRSAVAFGATGVVLPRHRGALVTPSVTKAAAGSIEHIAIASVSGIATALERASRAGVWTVGLAVDGATDITDLTVADSPVILVIGAEDRGLSRLVEARCDVMARIEIAPAVDSLNASAAAAIACHEIARRRRSAAR